MTKKRYERNTSSLKIIFMHMAFFAILAFFIIFLISLINRIVSRLYKNDFYCCPNCGKQFKTKWYKVFMSAKVGDIYFLRCPECRNRDWCGRIIQEQQIYV